MRRETEHDVFALIYATRVLKTGARPHHVRHLAELDATRRVTPEQLVVNELVRVGANSV